MASGGPQVGGIAWLHNGQGEWHARLVVGLIGGDVRGVFSPDVDFFGEQLSLLNADLEGLRFADDLVNVPAPSCWAEASVRASSRRDGILRVKEF